MHTATYSPEDNKLRLYAAWRLSDEEYTALKAAGFRWAGKQECFVCPRWTPGAEDALLALVDEIGDEDYSPEERSADRAERFGGYREKRRGEAHGQADTFDAGPSVFGHQNRNRAERQAARHDRYRTRAVSQWSKAEYWQQRTEGVISHALHRSSAPVRRSRIKRLEAEQRKHLATIAEARKFWAAWSKVPTLAGADVTLAEDRSTPAGRLAYALANTGCHWGFRHPRDPEGRETSLYSLLTDAADPITPAEAATLYLDLASDPDQPGCSCQRWVAHYELRLAYERAMLAVEGGAASDVEMEPGGWIGRHQIHKVNRSNTTGRVVSVGVWGPHPWRTKPDGTPQMGVQVINIERFGADVYRAPTDEEREAFKQSQKARKADKKATAPKKPQLINPTPAAARKLQDALNAKAMAYAAKHDLRSVQPAEVVEMTQAEYSARSGGNYSSCGAQYLGRGLRLNKETVYYRNGMPTRLDPVCKVRVASAQSLYGPVRVIVLTDKPQKPLPSWEAIEQAAEVTA